MTKEMKALYDELDQIKIKNAVAAYDFLGEEINEMDCNKTLDFEMSSGALKRINKDFKILKKYYKGKISMDPNHITMKYEEETQEYFFFSCLIKLMSINGWD
ncbi:MAG: hypothetical protein K8Q99_05305 [Acholeplasmataceae bacterium]|nr:hypothetical protein [Acholeplasmataceae bacterium]